MRDFKFEVDSPRIPDNPVLKRTDIKGAVAELSLPVVEVVRPVLPDGGGNPAAGTLVSKVSVTVPREIRTGDVMRRDVLRLRTYLVEYVKGVLYARVGRRRIVRILAGVAEEKTLPVLENYILVIEQAAGTTGNRMPRHETAVIDEMVHHVRAVPNGFPRLGDIHPPLIVVLDFREVVDPRDVVGHSHEIVERYSAFHILSPLDGVPNTHAAGCVTLLQLLGNKVCH